MSKWTIGSIPVLDPPEGYWGFTYRITDKQSGNYYIGAKAFWSVTNGKVSVKRSNELYKGRGAKPKREKKTKQSDWRTYCSSSTYVKALVLEKGIEAFTWEILELHETKTDLILGETLMILDTLCDPLCLNQWLKATIFKKNINCNK